MEVVRSRLPKDVWYEIEEYLVAGKSRWLEKNLQIPYRERIVSRFHGFGDHFEFRTNFMQWNVVFAGEPSLQLSSYSIAYTITREEYVVPIYYRDPDTRSYPNGLNYPTHVYPNYYWRGNEKFYRVDNHNPTEATIMIGNFFE